MGKKESIKLAMFISGGGSTMQAVLRACQNGRLPRIDPTLIVSSRREAGGIEKARSTIVSLYENIVCIVPKEFPDKKAYGEAILKECLGRGVDLIAMLGFIPIMPRVVLEWYKGMIFNQHPGPTDAERPGFGGKGMHGLAVHHAVLHFTRNGRRDIRTDATVHRAIDEVDGGEILGIRPVEIKDDDTAETLAARVLPHEHELVIETLMRFSEFGEMKGIRREIPLILPGEESLLAESIAAGRAAYPNG